MHLIASFFFFLENTKKNPCSFETHTIDLFDLVWSSEMKDYYDEGWKQLEDRRPRAVLS